MASALAKTASEPSPFNVKRSHTGTMVYETGASHFYAKHSIINVPDSVEVDDDNRRSSVKLKKLIVLQDGETRFPKLAECAHFHYEFVDFGELKLTLDEDFELDAQSEQWFVINVSCSGRKWTIRRTYESIYVLDKQLHRCIYDRKFSMLPELTKDLIEEEGSVRALGKISAYLNRFSVLADNMINCGPILCWMEMDNRGKRLIVPDNDAAVNIPAVAAAHAVKRYVAQSPDEISFEVGDILSIIDKPPVHESSWWRGKKGFEVGYFPSDFVELIGSTKIPPLVDNIESGLAKPVLHKRGKMTSFLIGFFSSRPNRTALKQTGIVKERVFGCDLGEHLLNTAQDVPLVLKSCAEVLEKHGIVDGIYRLCGVSSNLQRLRNEFDENRVPDLTTEMYLQDIHCISSLVKMYFRELPNPLLTYQLYDKFTSAIDADTYENKLIRLRELVRQLPPPHYRTAEFLFKHLSRMASFHSETSMHCKNLAIVWAPNLLRSKDLDQSSCVAALKGAGLQAVVTEFLIASVDEVFDDTSQPNLGKQDSGSCLSLTRPKSVGLPSSGTKLLSLEEAQERALGSATVRQQKYISVGDGPAALTSMYHTIIELPKDRKKNIRRSAISNWRSLFARTHSMTLPASISSQAKFSDSPVSAANTQRDGDSLRRSKRAENTVEVDGANDLLDGKRRSISCDVIDSASFDLLALKIGTSESNSAKPDDTDSISFDTLRSFQSASAASDQPTFPPEKPFRASHVRPSIAEQEQLLSSPLPSFRKGSRVTSRPLSESSPTESDKRSLQCDQWQTPVSSYASNKLFFDEDHFTTAKSSQFDSANRDHRISSSMDRSRQQSVSSFKPEATTETVEKTDFKLPNSNFKPSTKSSKSSICASAENICSSPSSRRLHSDEQDFLSWKLSETTGSRDLLSELSPAMRRVMPHNSYVSSAEDDSVFTSGRAESPDSDQYASSQSLNILIPVACDNGSIPEDIDGSVNVDEDNEEHFFDASCSDPHSKQFSRLESDQRGRKESPEYDFEVGSFRSCQNDSPLGSTVYIVGASRVNETDPCSDSASVLERASVSSSSERTRWKSRHLPSLSDDQSVPLSNWNGESANLNDGYSSARGSRKYNSVSGTEKNWKSSVGSAGSGRGSSKNIEKEYDSVHASDLDSETGDGRDPLSFAIRPLTPEDGERVSLSTGQSPSFVKSGVPTDGRVEVNFGLPRGSKSPDHPSKSSGSVSEIGKRRGCVSEQTKSQTRPSVPSRRSVQGSAGLTNAPGAGHRPESLLVPSHRNSQYQQESPSDDVFVSTTGNSPAEPLAANLSTRSQTLYFHTDQYRRSEADDSPRFGDKRFSSSDSCSSSSNLASAVERASASEFFSESENSSNVGPEGAANSRSSESAVYAEILRRRSTRGSVRREKPSAGAYSTKASAPTRSSDSKTGLHSSGNNFGSLKERKSVFEKAVLNSSSS